MRSKTTSNRAIQCHGGWLKRMVLSFTAVVVMLLAPFTALAGEWNWNYTEMKVQFTNYGDNSTFWAVGNGPVKTINKQNLQLIEGASQTQNLMLEGYFAVSGNLSGTQKWIIGSHNTYGKGLYHNHNGNRYLSVLHLSAGDKVNIVYSGTGAIKIVTNPNGETGSTVSSGQDITLQNDGDLDLEVGKANVWIQSITIKFSKTQLIQNKDVYGNVVVPEGNIDGYPYYRYRLSSRWFSEPTIRGNNVTYTVENYTSDNCKNPTGKEVAIAGSTTVNGNQVFDLMFKNEGWCKVTAKTGNLQQSYLVECWDNEAYYTVKYVEGQGMTYKLEKDPEITDDYQQGGVLKNRVVTAVPGITVKFGIPIHTSYDLNTNKPNGPENTDNALQPNTCVVGAIEDPNHSGTTHMVSYIYGDDGWWDRWPHDNYHWPQQGTYYVFKATADGILRLGGYKGGKDGSVYIINLSNPFASDARTTLFAEGTDIGYYDYTEGIPLKAGDHYALHGTSNDDGKWAFFGLEWFAFETNIKMTETYGVSDKTGYEIVQNNRTFDSRETFTSNSEGSTSGLKAQIVDKKGTVNNDASVSFNSNGTLHFTNVSFSNENKDKAGGALKVRIFVSNDNSWQEGEAYMDYVMTIPYGNHIWDFRQTVYQTQNHDGTAPTRLLPGDYSYTPQALVSMMAANGDDWSRVYKVHQRADGKWTQLISPILSARGSVVGNNAFYMDNTNGLIFLTGSESFGAEETQNQNGSEYVEYHGLKNIDDDVEYYYDWKTVTGADKVWIKGDNSSILFPGVKAGQYIRIYTYRHADNRGETFKAKNLIDLDDVPYDYNTTFKMRGFGSGSVGLAYQGDNMRGCAIFRVPKDYQPTNDPDALPRLTLCDIGWAQIFRIEILDEYKPDLMLTSHTLESTATDDQNKIDEDLPIEYDSEASSIVIRVNKNGVATPVKKGFRAISANTGCQNANTCEYKVFADNQGDVEESRVLWNSSRSTYNALILTFKKGNGLVRLVQREKVNTNSATTTTDPNGVQGYVIDKNEYYIAYGELQEKTYPYTWDFTTYNLYQGNSTTKTDLGNTTAGAYGNWNADGEDTEGNTFGQHHKEVVNFDLNNYAHVADNTKQLFAQGAQLASKNTAISETEGLGVRRPYGEGRKFYYMESHTEKDASGKDITIYEVKSRDYKSYDLEDNGISLDGQYMTGVGEVTIPTVDAGMYVFVKSKNEPTVSANVAKVSKYDSHVNNFVLENGVRVYKVNTQGDVVLTFANADDVQKIGVTDQFKQIVNTAGKTTESRAIAIDYKQTNSFVGIDMHAYRAFQYEDNNDGSTGTIKTEEVGPAAANQGFLLFSEGEVKNNGNVSCPLFVPAVNNYPETFSSNNNKLVANVTASTCPASTDDNYYYVFTNIYYDSEEEQHTSSKYSFYKVNEAGTLKANMAYLQLSPGSDNVGYTSEYVFLYNDESELNGIEELDLLNGVEEFDGMAPVFYNLNGVRMNGTPSQRGIYIVNGKKVYVK